MQLSLFLLNLHLCFYHHTLSNAVSSVFSTYIELGFHHIFDFKAYDHMLFLLALSAIYTLQDWKK
ncbi:hypothetical protein GCM10028895_26870 [Pontibacter rugosus]